jgi:hypothetical protein
MDRLTRAAVSLAGIALFIATPLHAADDVVQLVPESAVGVVVVNHLSSLDTAVRAVGQSVQYPLPTPTAIIWLYLGDCSALDENGSAAFAVLPPKPGSVTPTFLLCLPVTDCKKFIHDLHPTTTKNGLKHIEIADRQFSIFSVGKYRHAAGYPLGGNILGRRPRTRSARCQLR